MKFFKNLFIIFSICLLTVSLFAQNAFPQNEVFSRDGDRFSTTNTTIPNPNGEAYVTIDQTHRVFHQGELFVTIDQTHRVLHYSPAGDLLHQFTVNGGVLTMSVADNGELWVMPGSAVGYIVRFQPNGQFIGQFPLQDWHYEQGMPLTMHIYGMEVYFLTVDELRKYSREGELLMTQTVGE